MLFPEPDQPGVDLILPDFSYLDGRLDLIEAVVLTHAHEDHIGAHPVPAPGAAGHPAGRLQADPRPDRQQARRAPDHPATVEVAAAGRPPVVRPVRLEFLAVNHSIPDALAVRPSRPRPGVVLHTGDFKMDQLPLDGRLTDLGGFARLGARAWTC